MRSSALLFLCLLTTVGCTDSTVGTNNSAPTATILQPTSGAEFIAGEQVTLLGVVQDSATPAQDLQVSWSSSLDGELASGRADDAGETALTTGELRAGTHVITLQVRDAQGASGQTTTSLIVAPDAPPEIAIDSPVSAGSYYSDYPVTLAATVQDAEDPMSALRVGWSTSGGEALVEGEVPDSGGSTSTAVDLAAGNWTLEATVTDSAGNTRVASVTFVVGPPNSPPTCAITSPASLTSVPVGALVLLEGLVGDVDVGPQTLSASFSSNVDGPLGDATPSSAGQVALGLNSLSAGTHTLTLAVTDEVGGSCSDFIVLTVSSAPVVSILSPAPADLIAAGQVLSGLATVSDADDPPASLSLAWASNVDGPLATPTADTSGSVGGSFALTAGAHVLSLTATDASGLSGVDTVAVQVNAPPTAPGVSITPSNPGTGDALVASITAPSTDSDGPSAITYSYAWTRDGSPQGPFAPPETVPASATLSGEDWQLSVTASDGLSLSAPGLASVTIGNSPPSLGSVTITPSVAYTNTTLTAVPAGWSDADGDAPAYVMEWFADASSVGGDTATLSGAEFAKGDVITVLVTPVDASSSGAPVLSSGVTILNSLPSAPGVSISPAAPTDAQTLTCAVSSPSADLDADSVSYAYSWSNGAQTVAGASLSSSYTAAGQTWTCAVTPNDGDGDGPSGSAAASISAANGCPGMSPNTCGGGCASPASCLNSWPSLSCAPPTVTAAYFTNCSSVPFSGATWCFVVEGGGFQLDYTTQGGAMKWGSDRSGTFNGSNWNWLYEDQLVVTVGSWYSSYVGDPFWIENPDGQTSQCVTIGWQP